MKKLRLIAVLIAVTLGAAGLFTGCLPPDPKGGGTITIFIGEESYPVTTKKDYIGQVLDEMKANGEITFTFSGVASDQYGRMLLSLNTLNPQSDEYIAFYSDVDDDRYSFKEAYVDLNGVIYYFANYGIDQIPVFDGAKYLFRVEVAAW